MPFPTFANRSVPSELLSLYLEGDFQCRDNTIFKYHLWATGTWTRDYDFDRFRREKHNTNITHNLVLGELGIDRGEIEVDLL